MDPWKASLQDKRRKCQRCHSARKSSPPRPRLPVRPCRPCRPRVFSASSWLRPLDWAVVAVYAGGLIILGVLASRRRFAPVDYFLASRRTTWPVIGLSLLATNISSTALV